MNRQEQIELLARKCAGLEQQIGALQRLELPNQSLDTTTSPTFANLYVANGGFVGISGADGWTFDSTNGDISTTSKVGIGTTSPDEDLHVSKATYVSRDMLKLSNTINNNGEYIGLLFDASARGRQARIGAVHESTTDLGLSFWTDNSGTPSEAARIDADGNVGIGAASPNSLLELGFATENLELVDAGSTGATEQDWVQVEVGGVTGYIRVYATK